MQHTNEDPALESVLEELRRLAVTTYGEERAAERPLQVTLEAAATALWRVSQEPIGPSGNEPLPTDA